VRTEASSLRSLLWRSRPLGAGEGRGIVAAVFALAVATLGAGEGRGIVAAVVALAVATLGAGEG
jgi:hypothetical protein